MFTLYFHGLTATSKLGGISEHFYHLTLQIFQYCHSNLFLYVTVYGKTGHNAACVIIEKRSIEFLKMYCFKRTEVNG